MWACKHIYFHKIWAMWIMHSPPPHTHTITMLLEQNRFYVSRNESSGDGVCVDPDLRVCLLAAWHLPGFVMVEFTDRVCMRCLCAVWKVCAKGSVNVWECPPKEGEWAFNLMVSPRFSQKNTTWRDECGDIFQGTMVLMSAVHTQLLTTLLRFVLTGTKFVYFMS